MLAIAKPAVALPTLPLRFRFATGLPYTRQTFRHFASAQSGRYGAVVIGAGPGGLTCVSNLLDNNVKPVAMIDESFTGGRINAKYREVPSNTKVSMFDKWATGTKAFQEVLDRAPKNNAYDKLLSFDQDAGCLLGDAIDVALLLSEGLRADSRVTSIKSHVNVLEKRGSSWSLPELGGIETDRVVLAVGSHPRPHALADKYPHIERLDLDITLKPSLLKDTIPKGSKVAVVGSSHSAILALKNLQELPGVDVVNFYRSALLYAIYKEGWILYDNTGLKGIAAEWAKTVLAAPELPKNLRRINLKQDSRTEDEVYDAELKDCTHLVSAIGYEINPLPKIVVDGREVQPEFDPLTGRFLESKGGKKPLPGLFGAGIAYPERVTDPEGNVESAVGWFKFMKFVKRVAPEWAQNP